MAGRTRTKSESSAAATMNHHERMAELTATLTHDEIAREAYALYIANGAQDGQAERDWLEAERLLLTRRSNSHRIDGAAVEPLVEQSKASRTAKAARVRRSSR